MSYSPKGLDAPASMEAALAPHDEKPTRRTSHSSASIESLKKHQAEAGKEQQVLEKEIEKDEEEVEEDRRKRHNLYKKLRPFILGGLAALILGWWISATVLEATRHRWFVWLSEKNP